MSLRGSLETVGLPDVLTLLATTGKTGELQVTGVDIEGRLWVKDGQLIASDARRAPSHLDAVFGLLRISSGTFSFDEGGGPPEAGEPTDIEPLLVEAGIRLSQWADIEAAVPSLAHVVCMVADAPDEEVTVRADQWRLLAATGGGLPVHAVIDAVNLGDFDGSKALKELVEAGFVTMEEPPEVVAPPIVEPFAAVIEPTEPTEVTLPAAAAAPVAAAPAALVIEDEGSSLGGGLTFEPEPDTAPASVSDHETSAYHAEGGSAYDAEGGIELSPVGSPVTSESSDPGGTPSWSLDSTGDDEGMTWTNDSAGDQDGTTTPHAAATGDAPATWTHDPAGDAAAATWTHEAGSDAAAADTWTPDPTGEGSVAAWTQEPAGEAPLAAWKDQSAAHAAVVWSNEPAAEAPAAVWTNQPGAEAPAAVWTNEPGAAAPGAAWTHEPAGEVPVPEWTQDPAGDNAAAAWTSKSTGEAAPSWTPEAVPNDPVPAWSPAPVQADPMAYGPGAAMDSGFIPSQRAADVATAGPSAPPDAAPEAVADGSEAPLIAEEADTDEPINRGLLLKFLSSVRS